MHSVREQIESERAGSEIEDGDPDGPMREAVVEFIALANFAFAGVLEADRYGGVRHQQKGSAGQYPTELVGTSTTVPIPYFSARKRCKEAGNASASSCHVSSLQRVRSCEVEIAPS